MHPMSDVSASHHLAWPGCWLLLSGCLLAPPSCPNRPADPEIWFGEAVVEGGVQLRLGGYLVEGGGLKPIFEWVTAGSESATRRLFEPLGRAGHGSFVHALQHEAGVILLAAHEDRETLGVVVLGPTGEVQSAQEIQLEAPPFHYRLVSAQDEQGFVLGLSLEGPRAGLLWFGPQAQLIRSVILPGLSGVTDLVLHPDRSLSVLGPSLMNDRVADGVLRLSAEGEQQWQENLLFLDYVPGPLSDPSLATDGRGGTILLGGKARPLEPSVDLVLAQFDPGGTLEQQRRIPRPYPDEPLDWVLGPITQRAAGTPDGTLYVAATVPFERQANTYLTLIELDRNQDVLRQRAIAWGSQQLFEVRVLDAKVRVRGQRFLECVFDLAELGGCAAAVPMPTLVSLPVRSELESVSLPTRPGPLESWPVELVEWTPPD